MHLILNLNNTPARQQCAPVPKSTVHGPRSFSPKALRWRFRGAEAIGQQDVLREFAQLSTRFNLML